MNWTPPDGRFAVTLDEIVARSVGFEFDHEELDAFFILEAEIEDATDGLAEAKYEKCGSKELEQLADKLTALQRDLKTATRIDIALHHELEKFKRDRSCALHVVSADKDVDYPHFTKFSVYEWLRLKFNIMIEDWAPPGATHTHSSQPKAEKPSATAVSGKKVRKIREDGIASYHRVVQGLFLILMGSQSTYKGSSKEEAENSIARDIHDALHRFPGEEGPAIGTIEQKLRLSTDETGSMREDRSAPNQLLLDYQSVVRGLVLLVMPLFRAPKYAHEGKVNQSQIANEIFKAFDKRTKWKAPSKRNIERKLKDSNVGKIKVSESHNR